ncbi:hypothetical protein AUJ68_00495 [Candidatus Woesearchaeota archaeon CG1_02_57_44]|nr:MAG: hypothetical protein AUJ68_00495 [Candidatus Woesearchaeota archaeon CG1_02_57_44]PIN68320.1 MAG: hypothetical protein COV94_05275 [Candidatus Woesearchaeota archaeon CG11_big_fil_rev_8_21_14_0_20_57_5]
MASSRTSSTRTPLNQTFMGVSIIALIASILFTASGRLDRSWGFAFTLLFLIFIISAFYSTVPDAKK